MEMEKYINEQTVVKSEIYNAFKDDVTCSICSKIIINPLMCMNCQNVYCKKCIDDWSKKDKRCPNRCDNPNYKRSIEKSNTLSKLKFKCEKCGEEISYDNVKKHADNCESNTINGEIHTNNERIKRIKKIKRQDISKTKKNGKKEYIASITIITLGFTEVGKSSLIATFFEEKAHLVQLPTIGIPHSFETYQLSDGSLVNVKILDTVGQEKFKSISERYYKEADGCLLVYDITKRSTFDEIKEYYKEKIKEKCKEDIKIILLGNKTDLEEKREVPSEEGAIFAAENGYMFMETSCLQNKYVADCFETLIEIIGREAKEKNQTNDDEETIRIVKSIKKNKKNKNKGSSC